MRRLKVENGGIGFAGIRTCTGVCTFVRVLFFNLNNFSNSVSVSSISLLTVAGASVIEVGAV
jgi:hypothetical protein